MTDNPCDKCGKQVHTEFTVSNEVWSLVTGNTTPVDGDYPAGYWCIPCFITEAEHHADMDFPMKVHTRAQYYKVDF